MQRIPPDRIQLLPGQLANQIAAGEVVERPASVVKELIENSLDAGATRIDISVEEGGRQVIQVQDNGTGIHADDMALALTRHATSKIRSFDDLIAIRSLGFRGEALPSIASVSRFTLCSRYHDNPQAWRVEVDAQGRLSTAFPDPQPAGTRITVEELFHNTPARRRFLRSAKTEFVHIHDVVMRAALSRFDVAFSLLHNGQQVLRLPPAQDEAARQRRLAMFCGQAFTQHARPLDVERDGVRVHGWVMPAEQHRAQADRQFVFVNGRMMRDRMLLHAIRQAYASSLPPGRSAMFAIYIELDPARVDVNVHPTKHEVRFRELRTIHDLLFSAVQQALQGWSAVPGKVVHANDYSSAGHGVREYAGNYSTAQPATPRSASRIETILPGPFAVVNHADSTWLYDMQCVARQVFAARMQEQQRVIRPLLIPCRREVDVASAQWLEEHQQVLLQHGVEMNRLGEKAVICRGLSSCYEGADIEYFIEQLLHHRVDDAAQLARLAADSVATQDNPVVLQALLDELVITAHATCRRAISATDLRRLYRELPS